ncbi:hypothetical protein Tco_1297922, partial [Tanacetum coccineum]
MAQLTDELVGKVNSGQELDKDSLFRYCSVHVDGFPVSSSSFNVLQ